MRMTEIEIGASYEITMGLWRKVSIRAELDENENVDEVTKQLREKVDEIILPPTNGHTQTQIPQEPPPQPDTEETIVNEINKITNIEKLKSYHYIANNNYPKIQEAYNNKKYELDKQL